MFQLVALIFKLAFFILRLILKPFFGKRGPSLPRPFEAQVYVIDGDTVGVSRTNTRIRLHGIDAPERGQATGALSTKYLKALVLSEDLLFKPISIDRYNRIVAQVVRKRDGLSVNAAMVDQGFAIADTRYARGYEKLQRNARRKGRGLWKFGKIEDPAAWRRANT